jgi:hypothetical protein
LFTGLGEQEETYRGLHTGEDMCGGPAEFYFLRDSACKELQFFPVPCMALLSPSAVCSNFVANYYYYTLSFLFTFYIQF